MSACRSCGAQIEWARTGTGKLMPIEYDDGGTLLAWPGIAGELCCAVAVEPNDITMPGVQRAVSHFALCPKADEHRRPR